MQHTLLPFSERRTLRREYRLRALIIFLLMISAALVIGIVSLFPTYISILFEEKAELARIQSIKESKEQSGVTSIEDELKNDKKLMSLFNQPTKLSIPHSSIIESIVTERGNIKLTSIAIDKNATTSINVTMQGVAPTRDSLLAFKKKLEELVVGNKVDLPISQLAKSTNISFSLKLTQLLP